MFNERTTPRTKAEIDFLLESAFKSEGWETIKYGTGWMITIKLENDANTCQVIIQNLSEYISLSIILCSDKDVVCMNFLKDLAEKLNVKLSEKDSTYKPSHISIEDKGQLHNLVLVQSFDGRYISDFGFYGCLVAAINNLISIYSLFW